MIYLFNFHLYYCINIKDEFDLCFLLVHQFGTSPKRTNICLRLCIRSLITYILLCNAVNKLSSSLRYNCIMVFEINVYKISKHKEDNKQNKIKCVMSLFLLSLLQLEKLCLHTLDVDMFRNGRNKYHP